MKRIVAIEITPDFVRGVEVQNPLTATPKIVGFGEVPLAAGVAGDSEVFDESLLKAALSKLWIDQNFTTRKVILGIGGRKILNREFETPVADIARIRSKLKFETANILPPQMTDALLDFYPTEIKPSESGLDLVHGLLIAAPQQVVEQLVKVAKDAGLSVEGVDYLPFGLARTARKAFGATGEYLLVNIRPMATDIIALKLGVPQLIRVIPNGVSIRPREVGKHVDTDDRTSFNTEQSSSSDPITSLASGVRSTINFYSNKGGAPTALLLAGEGSLSPEVQERLPQEVELGAGLLSMADVFPGGTENLSQDPIQNAAALGLLGVALRGLKD